MAIVAYGKIPVFGILQRGVEVEPDSIIYSDAWHGYTGLVDLGYKKHYRVPMEMTSLPMVTLV